MTMFGWKPHMTNPIRYASLGQYQVWREDSYGRYSLVFIHWKYAEARAYAKPGDIIARANISSHQTVKRRPTTEVTDWVNT